MALPNLTFSKPTPGVATAGVTLAVYAPFGTDATLSRYPDDVPLKINDHPLVKHLVAVAAKGVHVSALIDLHEDDTWLVEITASAPTSKRVTSRWKQQMDAPNNLSGFLRHTRNRRPGTALVLALEGHGAGYLPELDLSKLTSAELTDDGAIEWRTTGESTSPVLPMGSPVLPMGSPVLPMGSPVLPSNHAPLSTWGLGKALLDGRPAGAERVGVIHFNNCFNMSVELLHTVAPHAEVAAGYMNYNFFTSGEAYPSVFAKLAAAGSATTLQLARWFAQANRLLLDQKSHHPTTGGVVPLSRMPAIAAAVDALAAALTTALAGASAAARPAVVEKIRVALEASQQYDTGNGLQLETPDELTDLGTLATALRSFDVNAAQVQAAAATLAGALKGIKAYGANATPWIAPNVPWDFSRADLAMNILCPDPSLRGLWDWRSPYYLQRQPGVPAAQPQVIDFLKHGKWVDFIIEYHRDVPFVGLLPAAIPEFPIFNRKHPYP